MSTFSVISWREQVLFWWDDYDDDDVHVVLNQHSELDFYSTSSLKQQSAKRHVAPLEHIILIPSKQYMLLHFSAASLVKKQH